MYIPSYTTLIVLSQNVTKFNHNVFLNIVVLQTHFILNVLRTACSVNLIQIHARFMKPNQSVNNVRIGEERNRMFLNVQTPVSRFSLLTVSDKPNGHGPPLAESTCSEFSLIFGIGQQLANKDNRMFFLFPYHLELTVYWANCKMRMIWQILIYIISECSCAPILDNFGLLLPEFDITKHL